MRVLLDTHVLIWLALRPERLSPSARSVLADPTLEAHISMMSAWELAIKKGLGRLQLPVPLDVFLHEAAGRQGAIWLPMRHQHVLDVEHLPPHHGDPIDRMLVAQARRENLRILSADRAFDAYAVERIW